MSIFSRAPACSGSSGQSKWIFSKIGSWGDLWWEKACPNGHVMVGARARSESNQGSQSDDTAGCSIFCASMHNLNGWHSAVGYDKKLLIQGEPVTSSLSLYSYYWCLALRKALTGLYNFQYLGASKTPLARLWIGWSPGSTKSCAHNVYVCITPIS